MRDEVIDLLGRAPKDRPTWEPRKIRAWLHQGDIATEICQRRARSGRSSSATGRYRSDRSLTLGTGDMADRVGKNAYPRRRSAGQKPVRGAAISNSSGRTIRCLQNRPVRHLVDGQHTVGRRGGNREAKGPRGGGTWLPDFGPLCRAEAARPDPCRPPDGAVRSKTAGPPLAGEGTARTGSRCWPSCASRCRAG
jgi:hypothetical protein